MSNASINYEGFGAMTEIGQTMVVTNDQLKEPEVNILPLDDELNAEQVLAHEALDAEFLATLSIASRRDERVMAFLMLYSIDRSDYQCTLATTIDSFNEEFSLNLTTEHFAAHLVAKVFEQRNVIDEIIRPYLKNWRLERLGCCTRLLLRLALAELLNDNVIPSVVINETIELAKQFAEKDSYKFINGILDEICKAGVCSGTSIKTNSTTNDKEFKIENTNDAIVVSPLTNESNA